MEWLQAIGVVLCALAAILAWVAKLRWAREYTAAKEETIRAKEAQVETLRTQVEALQDMTPMKLREYFLSVKEQLEEYIGTLQARLHQATEKIRQEDGEIEQLTAEGGAKSREITALRREKDDILTKQQALGAEVQRLRRLTEGVDPWTLAQPGFLEPALLERISTTSLDLRNALMDATGPETGAGDSIPDLSDRLVSSIQERQQLAVTLRNWHIPWLERGQEHSAEPQPQEGGEGPSDAQDPRSPIS